MRLPIIADTRAARLAATCHVVARLTENVLGEPRLRYGGAYGWFHDRRRGQTSGVVVITMDDIERGGKDILGEARFVTGRRFKDDLQSIW